MRKTCITVSVEVAGGLEEALEALELEVDGLADRFPEPDRSTSTASATRDGA